MQVYYDSDLQNPAPRVHPYAAALPYAAGRPDPKGFIDFVARPELIETSLEDFVPYAHRGAIRTFFDFLRWINGPDSPLETCDCGLRPPESHDDRNSHLPVRLTGRVFLLFRDLQFNCSRQNSDWLCGYTKHVLEQIDPELPASEAVVGFTQQPALHLAFFNGKTFPDGSIESGPDDPCLGHHLMLTWFVYGNTEDETFAALDRTIQNIWTATRRAAAEIQRGLESTAATP